MVHSPDALTSGHVHVADAIGFNVPMAVLSELKITEAGPFCGRTVRCSVGEHPDYVMVANSDCDGRNVNATEFQAAVAAAILAHYS